MHQVLAFTFTSNTWRVLNVARKHKTHTCANSPTPARKAYTHIFIHSFIHAVMDLTSKTPKHHSGTSDGIWGVR